MKAPRIIRVQEKHLETVLVIEQESFHDPWSFESFRAELDHPWSRFCLIGPPDRGKGLKEISGYIICWILPGDLHLLNLAVGQPFRRQGLAKRLLEHSMNEFGEAGGGLVSLEVRRSNLAAQNLYTVFGFQVVGVRRGYYRNDNEDALVMARHVDESAKGESFHAGT